MIKRSELKNDKIQRFPMIVLRFVRESLSRHSRFLVSQLTGMSIYKLRECFFDEENENDEIIDAIYLGYSEDNYIFSRNIRGKKEYIFLEDRWAVESKRVIIYHSIDPGGYSSITKELIKKQRPELKSQLLKMLKEIGEDT